MSDLYKITTTSEEFVDRTCVMMKIELSRELENDRMHNQEIQEAIKTCVRAIYHHSFRTIDKLFFNFCAHEDKTITAKIRYLDLFLSSLNYEEMDELKNIFSIRIIG